VTSPSGQAPEADLPQRVSTLELFFDLVFVFTITQLTSYLARDVTLAAAGIALLMAVVAAARAVEGRAGHDTVEA